MAFTVTREHSVAGNKRVVFLSVLADGAEANISTGLSVIDGYALGLKSFSTAAVNFYVNQNSTAAASNGTLACSGLASGDTFSAVVYGR